MMSSNDWYRSGPFLLREREVSTRQPVKAGFVLLTPGWEARSLAVLEILDCPGAKVYLLDFEVSPESSEVVNKSKAALAKFSPDVEALSLRKSVDLDQNVHTIKSTVRSAFQAGIYELFIDITSLPKSYIQSLASWIFSEGLFPHVTFGYAEGVYMNSLRAPETDRAVSFETVKPMIGMKAPCQAKRLIAILGGERANCYALIERSAPDHIHLLGTTSDRHVELKSGIEAQLGKIKVEYGDRLVQEEIVSAFSLRSLLDAIDFENIKENKSVATTIFAGGTKPHALAASIVALANSDVVELRYRKVQDYIPTEVTWSGRYFLYDIVDLRSERLPSCEIF